MSASWLDGGILVALGCRSLRRQAEDRCGIWPAALEETGGWRSRCLCDALSLRATTGSPFLQVRLWREASPPGSFRCAPRLLGTAVRQVWPDASSATRGEQTHRAGIIGDVTSATSNSCPGLGMLRLRRPCHVAAEEVAVTPSLHRKAAVGQRRGPAQATLQMSRSWQRETSQKEHGQALQRSIGAKPRCINRSRQRHRRQPREGNTSRSQLF